ncbi:3-hydroxybutyrate dehydrogenase [Rhodospirillum rubrum]|uniref:3-hydroxybutyrate dehydrogenase n=1 Tax=Rhodospirillum rubrum (strain ATCC 11170 / ATH 1.1.1 / DSM 467 / LMG 4362 / NCIMB 8255 / S1) TaxID=269796 RepID=Q2RVI7_RHORT|nr:3-hydroxybutyrate dehydrogenase [Rhodospirillum rubrum]ABC21858.1 3-hydroxybutyrate dehydrogenase [Rhodospirillum rubrum ATCC 11170]MBK5953422.1 3-hydroxybutyrate dehydrogenase [Rhodospirillum rubrum]QXG81519.1 3-hydroxybutyrate dehydrogenase [Rhodospirillum rubrum]HAQ01307.1 3-hydroxybutyrate dehydrogenase [Rhodospirillum rubrum]HCF18522.1 3-hydroxybutyrate dehydrogenase [Rhodospirillum rubrum]
MKGKCAVVTGSTSGIGLGIARALAGQGVDIVLNGFGAPEAIEDIRKDIETSFSVRAIHIDADLAQGEACRALIAQAIAEMGQVDILVNNAGIQHTSDIVDFPPERWNSVIAINLSAVFHCTAAALPGMRERDWGRVINVASAHGLVASVGKAAYVAAKHGVLGLTKVAALENATRHITVNAICPGWVLTPLVQAQIDARAARDGVTVERATVDLLSEKQPTRRFVTPEQIGAMAVYLCSEAADTLTGVPLSIDGGWTAQ